MKKTSMALIMAAFLAGLMGPRLLFFVPGLAGDITGSAGAQELAPVEPAIINPEINKENKPGEPNVVNSGPPLLPEPSIPNEPNLVNPGPPPQPKPSPENEPDVANPEPPPPPKPSPEQGLDFAEPPLILTPQVPPKPQYPSACCDLTDASGWTADRDTRLLITKRGRFDVIFDLRDCIVTPSSEVDFIENPLCEGGHLQIDGKICTVGAPGIIKKSDP